MEVFTHLKKIQKGCTVKKIQDTYPAIARFFFTIQPFLDIYPEDNPAISG